MLSIVDENPWRLSRREWQCICLKGKGIPEKQIAVLLTISIHTVREHMRRVRIKTKATCSIHAVWILWDCRDRAAAKFSQSKESL